MNGHEAKNGRFEVALTDPYPDGTVDVSISAPGYRYYDDVRKPDPDLGEFRLEPMTVVSGRVLNADGGLAPAQLSVENASRGPTRTEDGKFSFELDPSELTENVVTSG